MSVVLKYSSQLFIKLLFVVEDFVWLGNPILYLLTYSDKIHYSLMVNASIETELKSELHLVQP